MATDKKARGNRGSGKKGEAKPGHKPGMHESGVEKRGMGRSGAERLGAEKPSSGKRSGDPAAARSKSDASHISAPPETSPWHVPVSLDEIPPQGLHRDLQASKTICADVATFVGLNYINNLSAFLQVDPQSGGRYRVHGRVTARVGQNCVVTLEAIENQIAEEVDVTFVPPDQLPDGYNDADRLDIAALINEEEDLEPITDGMIDLGRLAVEFLILGIDPYPRKVDAALAISLEAPDPAEHPFAGLAALKGALKDKDEA